MKKDIEWLESWFDDDKSYPGGYVKFKINRMYNAKNLSQKAPVSPQEDRFITECKLKGYSLHEFVHCAEVSDENCERLTRAWLDGYEVEEEQKYNVQLKVRSSLGTVGVFLYKQGDEVLAGDNFKAYYPEEDKFRLTEQEIKDFDQRCWEFRKPV